MAKKQRKVEALTVQRFITDVLIGQLKFSSNKIVNDTTFSKYTGSKRPDLLISNIEYQINVTSQKEYIENLLAYAEAKDVSCKVNDKDWKDAINQGKDKSKKLGFPYFIVTNCKTSIFYNSETLNEILLNGNPLREFPTEDVLRLIKKQLTINSEIDNISTSIDTQNSVSETIFNKKLWELANIYRSIDFQNITEKIDFTIGLVALKYYEEKIINDGTKNEAINYWSDLNEYKENKDSFRALFCGYIQRITNESNFNEFRDLLNVVLFKFNSGSISDDVIVEIYDTIESVGSLHGCGFDLFGAVYEMFASNKEKGDFGEFFTRRHYTHIFAKLLLKSEIFYDSSRKFKILDTSCGTGGFLTEAYRILKDNYIHSNTIREGDKFLKEECIYGYDIRIENVSRTKLNMFLVGDGHTNIVKHDTLTDRLDFDSFDYIATNPPMGNGIVKAESTIISTTRYEIAFIVRIIKLLKVGGKAVVIMPDGFLENPSFGNFRMDFLEKCHVNAIVSLPKFAFAPYTKEKTYALFFQKKAPKMTKIQSEDIWMYIIDNDGYANSDNRFPTKLKNEKYQWLHDEISSWIDKDGVERTGLLEDRWLKFDDSSTTGTEWLTEKGINQKSRKGGFIKMTSLNTNNYYNLLPEFHLRKREPSYITFKELNQELKKIKEQFSQLSEL
jgi:type I restriction enzyme M protein